MNVTLTSQGSTGTTVEAVMFTFANFEAGV